MIPILFFILLVFSCNHEKNDNENHKNKNSEFVLNNPNYEQCSEFNEVVKKTNKEFIEKNIAIDQHETYLKIYYNDRDVKSIYLFSQLDCDQAILQCTSGKLRVPIDRFIHQNSENDQYKLYASLQFLMENGRMSQCFNKVLNVKPYSISDIDISLNSIDQKEIKFKINWKNMFNEKNYMYGIAQDIEQIKWQETQKQDMNFSIPVDGIEQSKFFIKSKDANNDSSFLYSFRIITGIFKDETVNPIDCEYHSHSFNCVMQNQKKEHNIRSLWTVKQIIDPNDRKFQIDKIFENKEYKIDGVEVVDDKYFIIYGEHKDEKNNMNHFIMKFSSDHKQDRNFANKKGVFFLPHAKLTIADVYVDDSIRIKGKIEGEKEFRLWSILKSGEDYDSFVGKDGFLQNTHHDVPFYYDKKNNILPLCQNLEYFVEQQGLVRLFKGNSFTSCLKKKDPWTFFAGKTKKHPYYYPQIVNNHSITFYSQSNYADLKNSRKQQIKFDNLEDDSQYYYQVADSVEINRVRTNPIPGEFSPFQFAILGDTQGSYDPYGNRNLNKDRSGVPHPQHQASRATFNNVTKTILQTFTPDFVLLNGDIVEDGRYYLQYSRQLFQELKYLITASPLYLTLGNHETYDPRTRDYLYFGHDNSQREKDYLYSFRWGKASFFALNSNAGSYDIFDIDELPSLARKKNSRYLYQKAKNFEGIMVQINPPRPMMHAVNEKTIKLLENEITDNSMKKLSEYLQKKFTVNEFRQLVEELTEDRLERRKIRAATIHCKNCLGAVNNQRVEIWSDYRERFAEAHKWIDQQLQRREHKNQDYLFIFQHHAVLENYDLAKIIEKHNISAIFRGHDHNYRKISVRNFEVITSGGGSNTATSFPHFIKADVDQEKATFTVITGNGKVHDKFIIPSRRSLKKASL